MPSRLCKEREGEGGRQEGERREVRGMEREREEEREKR
jgi:hypothetical protein